MHSFTFSFQIRATLLRPSRHAPNIEPLTRVKSNPIDVLRLTLPCFLHDQSFAARCWWAQRSKLLFSTRPLPPTGSNDLTYPHVTSHTPALGRMATPARVRSPMHIDPASKARVRTGSSLPLLRHPLVLLWRLKVGELAQGHRRRLPSRSDERYQRGTHRTLGGTSVGSMLATYETLVSLTLSWWYLATLHLTHKKLPCFYPCSCVGLGLLEGATNRKLGSLSSAEADAINLLASCLCV